MLTLKYKLWLDRNGKAFGEGPCFLLKEINRTGSLNNAAKQMKMSYSQAYNLLKKLEERLGFNLIESRIGGSGGGGSTLTKEAVKLIETYEDFVTEAGKELDLLFEEHFKEYLKS